MITFSMLNHSFIHDRLCFFILEKFANAVTTMRLMKAQAIAGRFVLRHAKILAPALNRINVNVNMALVATFVKLVSQFEAKVNEMENSCFAIFQTHYPIIC